MLKEKVMKRELKFYGTWNLIFLGPIDVTSDECQLNVLKKLVSIVSQSIIQKVKLPKQFCQKKSIDAMKNTTEAPITSVLVIENFSPIATNHLYLNLLKSSSSNFLQYNSITRQTL